MEFDEQEFLSKLDEVTTTEEFRDLVKSIPLTKEDMAELEKMERQRLTG